MSLPSLNKVITYLLTYHEIRHFHVVVVQQQQRNVQKSVMHVLSCCFANVNLLLFCRSLCRLSRRCLSSLIISVTGGVFDVNEFPHNYSIFQH